MNDWVRKRLAPSAARAAKPLEADLYESGQARELLAEIHRNAEDAVRSALGVPAVGQGWLRETELYVRLREALPGVEVVQHGVPLGFDRQHLDVWIPAWRVGVEYQGVQHFQPIALFGGEEGLARTRERDERKRTRAAELGIIVIDVEPGYDLAEVVARVKDAAARTGRGTASPPSSDVGRPVQDG